MLRLNVYHDGRMKKIYLIVIASILLLTYHGLFSVIISDIDYFNFLTETLVTIIVFISIVYINIKFNNEHHRINLGLIILFISLLTDTLDEIYISHAMIGTVFEDLLQIVGFVVLLVGIKQWLNSEAKIKTQLYELAHTDTLTKLVNRRHFDNVLKLEFQRYFRSGNTFCVLLMDIDHFKSVNDNQGHNFGDAVLIQFSDVTNQNIRTNDVLCRWGGDEFALLLPNTNLEQSILVSEKIRESISTTNFGIAGSKMPPITISIGCTQAKKSDTIDSLFQRVDKLLYTSKDNGRNQTAHSITADSGKAILV